MAEVSAETEPKPVEKVKRFPPWNPVIAVTYVVAAYLGASIIGEIILEIYASFRHWNTAQFNNWVSNSVAAPFANSILVYGLMLLAIYVYINAYKVTLKQLGLVRPRLKDVGIALLGALVYVGIFVVLEIISKIAFPHLDVNQQQDLGFQVTHNLAGKVVIFLSLVILPPLVEEILMRGYLFTSLLKRLSFVPAALITSVIFATAHLQLGSGSPPLWIAAIDTFSLSLVLCYMRFKTGSLWPGILLHGLKNCVAFLAIFVFVAS